MPPKIEINISVSLTAVQLELYRSLLKKMDLTDLTGLKGGFKNILA